MKAISLIFRKLTLNEFKAITNTINSSGGGSQTYIDFPKGCISDNDFKEFFDSEGTPNSKGFEWVFYVNSLSLGYTHQKETISARRDSSNSLREQNNNNRIEIWKSNRSGFPVDSYDEKENPIIVYIIKSEENEYWAGWFYRNKCNDTWPMTKGLSSMLWKDCAYIKFDSPISFDSNDYTWPFLKSDSSNIKTMKLQDQPLQQIYYGAPGTGKSNEINKFTSRHKYATIRTTFHPDSDYSTFVGAYKPIMEEVDVQIVPVAVAGGITLDTNKGTYKEKRISYRFVKQAFLKAYLAAWKKYAKGSEDGMQPQFLVIEEINRGNCAQIFGDLFQLLDRQDNGFSSYPIEADADLQREIGEAFAEEGGEYQLPEGGMNLDGVLENYNGDLESDIRSGRILLLPRNLYIWATMNTSDQSLFPIDSAFKRRWDWHYVKIADAKKGYKIECGDEACDWWKFVSKMNDKIAEETSSDDKKLGYFFCKPDKEGGYISLKRFVSKVIFYLWNDVYKDGNTEDFNVSDDPLKAATFEAFYNDDNTENVANVRKFLVNIVGEVNMVKSDDIKVDDNEEYPGTQASEDDHAHDDWSETEKKRYQYWDALLKYAPNKSKEFAKYFGGVKTPSHDHWKSFSVSDVDFHLAVLQQRKKRAIEMELCYDETTEEYHKLYSHKAEIEAEMGVTYQWQELPDKKSSYISEYKSDVDFDNQDAWPEQFDFIIDRLLRMRAVFSKYAKM